MSNTIFSTCGTSILTNKAPAELRESLIKNANVKSVEDWRGDFLAVEKYTKQRADMFQQADIPVAKEMSADLNSLLTWYGADIQRAKQDTHYLLHTDTWQGEQTAKMIGAFLEKLGVHAQTLTATNLRTNNQEAFKNAIKDLTRLLRERIPERNGKARVVFNLSGGFKSLNAFLQVLANLWADETIFMFDQAELMVIPRLPLLLDTSAIEQNLSAARRLVLELDVTQNEIANLPDIYYVQLENQYLVSDFGQLLIEEALPSIYEKKLYAPPSARVQFGTKFEESLKGYVDQARKLAVLQERIDDFCRFVETGINPRRLKAHSLETGEIRHEFYVWPGDAARAYYNVNGDVHIIEKIGPHR